MVAIEDGSVQETISVDDLWQRFFSRPEEKIDPAQDARTVLDLIYTQQGINLEPSKEHYQEMARDQMEASAKDLINSYSHYFNSWQRAQLQLLNQGVIVISNLANQTIKSEIIFVLERFPEGTISLIPKPRRLTVSTYGLVVSRLTAVLLDETSFSRGIESFICGHEALHVVSEGNLPRALDEAITDILAERATSTGYAAEHRMGTKHEIAHKTCLLLEEVVGTPTLIEAYLKPAVVKETVARSGKTVRKQYVDSPLHEKMRAVLGNNWLGRSKWDKFIRLAEKDKIRRAGRVLARGLGSSI